MFPTSSTAARQIGTCHQCGFAVYENLVHHCSTAVKIVVAPSNWFERGQDTMDTVGSPHRA